MTAENTDCANCGAPLALQSGQTWAICGFCNSSLRLSVEGDAARYVPVPEVPAEVVQEVKQLLRQGYRTRALNYYAQEAGIEAPMAEPAVTAMMRAIGYQPPLNTVGLLMLAGTAAASLAGVAGGAWLTARGQSMIGVALIAGAVLFARLNWKSLFTNLGATRLYHWGRTARAIIQKRWQVVETRAGKDTDYQIVRLLLKVEPEGLPAYQTEATCVVGQQSQAKFQAGSAVWVKYDPRRRQEVVVTGADQTQARPKHVES